MKCFYHTDMDGHCSGAIVRKAMMGETSEFIPINYNNYFPFDSIKPGEKVVIVDFSLQEEGGMEKLLHITDDVIWIDHHKTAIEKNIHLNDKVKGIRVDGVAACVLTWQYFFPDDPIPIVVEFLGDYDIWAFKFGDNTNKLQAGIRLYNTLPESLEWNRWLFSQYYPQEEIEKGEIALKYRDNYYRGLIRSWSFYTIFEGYKAVACNACSVSSHLFETADGDYDIMIPFVFDGRQWSVSLYTKRPDIDVSEIAKKYGGGGHKQAAGFQCDDLPFKRM